ncbi:hypothetical protein Zmor_001275 [Zophobas morio]|uniref:Uncharacterized protein n=1 Tax=Zophobas morio TaxID=2755281 RepID=A0AA38J4Z5_9CUCU|nr:hypothetical protein Zmor_001275 [Zophobas morio]
MQGAGCEDIDRGVVQCPSSPANVLESVWGRKGGRAEADSGDNWTLPRVSGHLTRNCSGSSTIPHVSCPQPSLITATRRGATLDVSEIGKHSNNTLNSHITRSRGSATGQPKTNNGDMYSVFSHSNAGCREAVEEKNRWT